MNTRRSSAAGGLRCGVALAAAALLVALLPMIAVAQAVDWNQLGNTVEGESDGDRSGAWVVLSADGTTMATSAPLNDAAGESAGHVRIFRFDGAYWNQLGSDIDGESGGDRSGAIAMSDDGMTVAIGAARNSGAATKAGHVRVYRYDGADWSQIGIDIDGQAAEEYFGYSVSLSADGETVAIGALTNSNPGLLAGTVRVYRYDGADWSQIGTDLDGEGRKEYFGRTVALSNDGTILAVGAPGSDAAATRAGRTQIFRFDGADWQQLGNNIDGTKGDWSGYSVALSNDGETVVVGARYNQELLWAAGAARVYKFDGVRWNQVGSTVYGDSSQAGAGWTVAIDGSGDTIAVGAPYHHHGGKSHIGQARAFRFDGIDWQQLGREIVSAEEEYAGNSVALSDDGNTFAVAASSAGSANQGDVRVFSLEEDGVPSGPLQSGTVVFVKSIASGRYLDGDGVHRAWNVDTSPDALFDARWKLIDNGDGTWSLLNQRRTRYLDGDGVGQDWNVGLSTQINKDDRWEVSQAAPGIYTLRNIASGRYLNQAPDNNVNAVGERNDTTEWEITPVG